MTIPPLSVPTSVPFAAVDVLGTAVHVTRFAEAIDFAERAIRQRQQITVSHVNVHTVIEARRDPELRHAFARCHLRAADGMPLVWMARNAGHPAERLYGPDFLRAMLDRTNAWVDRPCRHFFYGSTPQVLDLLATALRADYPAVEIAGLLSPPFRPLAPHEEQQHWQQINDSRPDVLWVGLGAPRQEKWMARAHPHLNVPLIAAVGAAFDFVAGHKRQAPRWMQRHGLEWLFRLSTEPKRLAGRYGSTIPQFAALLAWEKIRRRR